MPDECGIYQDWSIGDVTRLEGLDRYEQRYVEAFQPRKSSHEDG